MFPSWFKPETGFMFLDPRGDLTMVLGKGGYREPIYLGVLHLSEPYLNKALHSLEFKKDCLVAAYLYKGDWFLCDLSDTTIHSSEFWHKSSPFPFQGKEE